MRPVRWILRRPFVTALGRKTHSDNVLVRARLAGGAEGWGEASSSLAMPFQTGPRMAAALRRLGRALRGRDVRDLGALTDEIWRAEGEWPAAAAACETALWDALARAERRPLYSYWGGAAREIETVLSISAVAPEEVGRRARTAARRGWRVLKLKLNGAEGDVNRARLRAAAQAAPRARILVDPNQSYRPESLDALYRTARADGIALELVEEPFPKQRWGLLAEQKGRPPRIVLDESVQNAGDARRVARGRLAAGVNVKLAKSGPRGVFEIVKIFRRLPGAPLMIGCMAESRLGLSAAVHLALGAGVFDYADLDSDLLLRDVPIRGGYVRRGAWLALPKNPRPGLGVEVGP